MSHVELGNLLQNLSRVAETETAKMNSRVELAGEVLYDAVRKQASLTDHSLKDLANLGHPYSTKFPADGKPHGDDTLVHIQKGKLYNNIEKQSDIGTLRSSVAVGVSRSKVDYIDDLMTGTTKMRPRRFIQKAFALTDLDSVMAGKGRK